MRFALGPLVVAVAIAAAMAYHGGPTITGLEGAAPGDLRYGLGIALVSAGVVAAMAHFGCERLALTLTAAGGSLLAVLVALQALAGKPLLY